MDTLYVVAFVTLAVGLGLLFLLRPRGALPNSPLALQSMGPRTQLRAALMGDEAKVQRLVDYERRRNPSVSQREAERNAYQRWLQDQRG